MTDDDRRRQTTTDDERRRHDASHANTAPTPRPPTINGNPSLRIRAKKVGDASSPRKEDEQTGSVAADLALAAEQVAMQAMHDYQVAAQGAPEQDIAQPPLHLYSNLPREWPMARLCIVQTSQQIYSHCHMEEGG